MANMTYRDVPVVRAAAHDISSSGYTWYLRDKDGQQWSVSEDEDESNLLTFRLASASIRMSREKFDELFVNRSLSNHG